MAGPQQGRGQHPCWSLSRRGRFSDTAASCTSSSRLSILLCCRWWNSCRMFTISSPRVCRLLPSRLSDVPKIILEDIPSRRLCREPQLAEQLVEVPTILCFLKQTVGHSSSTW